MYYVWQLEEGSFMKNPRNKDKQHFSATDATAEGSNTGTTKKAMKEEVAADNLLETPCAQISRRERREHMSTSPTSSFRSGPRQGPRGFRIHP